MSRLRFGMALRIAVVLSASLFCVVPLARVRPDTPQDRRKERDSLDAELKQLKAADKIAEAIAVAEKLLILNRQTSGDVVAALGQLANLYERQENFAAARAKRQEALDTQVKQYGKDDWRAIDARRALGDLESLTKLDSDSRRQLLLARRLSDQVEDLGEQEKYDQALPLAQQAVDIRKRLLGERHPDYADSLVNLGWIYREKKDYARSEALYQQALKIEKETVGEAHPLYANALNNLGWLHVGRKEYAKAEAVFRQAADIYRRARGEKDLQYVVSLNNLQYLYFTMRDYPRSEALLQRVVAIRREVQGEEHPDHILSVETLAFDNQCMQQYARAEELYRRAVDLRKRAVGENDRRYANTLNKLARLYYDRDDYAQAEPLFRQVLEIRKRALGERHPAYTSALHNLAAAHKGMGAYARAQPLYEEALAIKKETVGEKDPSYATSLDNLASLFQARKDYAKAEGLYQQSLAIREAAGGEKSEDYIHSLNNLGVLYDHMGDYDRAIAAYRRVLELAKAVAGEADRNYVITLGNMANSLGLLAEQDADREAFAAARRGRVEIREIYARLYAPTDYRQTDARLEIDLLDRLERMSPEERKQLIEAKRFRSQANELMTANRFAAAIPLAERALEIRQRIFGEKNYWTLQSLSELGFLNKETGQYAKALALRRRTLDLSREVLGEKHPFTITDTHNLAAVNEAMGNLREAERLYREALALRKEVQGEKHLLYATTLNSLAVIYGEMGDQTLCERYYRESLRIRKEVRGEASPEYADGLLNLGWHYKEIGDYAKAEPLMLQAVTIYKNVYGENHAAYARGIDFLAVVYANLNESAKAEPLYKQSVAIRKAVLGENHPDYATSLQNSAMLYTRMKQYARAEALYREALAIDRKARGDKYFGNATVITNLSLLLDEKGEYEKAEPLFQEALQIYEQATGRDSANYRTALFRMAEHQASRGDAAAAERLIREVLRTSRRHFQQTLATQSEREQLAYRGEVRGPLNLYLSLTATDAAKAEDVYAEVLAWKAPVSALQALIRRARRADQSAGRAQAGELYTALEDASHKLSVLSRAAPDPKHPNQLRQDLQDTSDRVEALQRDLAAASGEFRQAQDRQRRTADDVRTALPDDAVLVDLLEYARFQPAGKGGASDVAPLHLAAFVLRKGRPVVRVELGPVAPLTQALDEWRRELARPGTEARHGAELRAALWQPLESHLGDARVVLLSPSGALARLPFAALPGREPGRYLIEDRALAVVPVPDLLPDLVASHSPAGWEPSLLVVSAVDFDAAGAAGDAAAAAVPQPARPGPTLKWPPLPGTRAEADALSRAFRGRYPGGTVVDLRAGQATDATVRREAPHRAYLHFATHGYFAPPQLKSAAAAASRSEQAGGGDLFVQKDVAGFHPGLLSGLVLAGANRPDAGMLTALEVENLDLSGVELATLSACETGLGEYAGGEGLLGLQRAFQTAGARTVLAGLWKVDDAATQALMTEFYARLWDGKHSKLEALRQAQLTLLHTYDPAAGRQRGVGGVAVDAPARVAGGKLPPFYWAAFALSGDWR